jgi:hypothetical protein
VLTNTEKVLVRLKAVCLVRDHLGALQGGRPNAKYNGIHGGDHIVSDTTGRLWRVDLVLSRVTLCEGVPPRVQIF